MQLEGESELQTAMRRMAAEGRVALGRMQGLKPLEPVAVLDDERSLAEAIIQDREHRL